MLKEAIEIYNNERRHKSLEMQTPNFAHTKQRHPIQIIQKDASQGNWLKIFFCVAGDWKP